MKDLDWLARNVHEWPKGAHNVRLDADGEVCFIGEYCASYDFYPENIEYAKSHFSNNGNETGEQ